METNPLKQGMLTENSVGIGTVTRGMVRMRAMELAIIDGRSAHEASLSDWEQAKIELTGRSDSDSTDSNEAALNAAPESERWNPIFGSTGEKMTGVSSEDEDNEGRSDSERLVQEGVGEAEHDLLLEAARAHRKEDHAT